MEMFLYVMKFVAIGTVSMTVPMMTIALLYKIKVHKGLISTLFATVAGVFSAYFWFFLEKGAIGGISFFGAVFIEPIAFLLLAQILKEDYYDLIDMFAPGICMMLVVMKIQCYLSGCCGGRVISLSTGLEFVFPSQLAECINAAMLMVIILIISFTKKFRGKLYPLYLIMYGITRFILNFFRQEFASNTDLIPPLGSIWSIVAIIIGFTWLYRFKKSHKNMIT